MIPARIAGPQVAMAAPAPTPESPGQLRVRRAMRRWDRTRNQEKFSAMSASVDKLPSGVRQLNAKLRGLPIPERMRRLPIDERGWLVPWFVAVIDGKPDHRVMDGAKWREAVKFRRCWQCGEPLGARGAFVLGPMCAVNRTNGEPPNHYECARFAVTACPHLSRPRAVRRGDPLAEYEHVAEAGFKGAAGYGFSRNPGAIGIWVTRTWSVFKVPPRPGAGPGYLVQIGEPERVEWYSEGRPATRAEVEASIEGGLPLLMAKAQEQDREEPGAGAVKLLRRMVEQAGPWLPAASA